MKGCVVPMNEEEIRNKVNEANNPETIGLLSSQMKEHFSELIENDKFEEAQALSEAFDKAISDKRYTIQGCLDTLDEIDVWNSSLAKSLKKANREIAKKAEEKERFKSDPNGLLEKKLGKERNSSIGNQLRTFVLRLLPDNDSDEC